MVGFSFTDSQWNEISAEIAQTGREQYDGDRQTLEMICDYFAQLRPRLGRDQTTPKKARAAWQKVAASAQRLEQAISELEDAGAAAFSFLDNHQGRAIDWAAQLPLLRLAAEKAAELEVHGAPTVSNNADPMLDGFVKQLTNVWQEFGGHVTHSENGPLVRYLIATTKPVLASAGEQPMTVAAIQGSVRRINSGELNN